MAYQFSSGIALNTTDFIKKLYTFAVTTTGWTVIQDASFSTGGAASANTYLAISSTGESGNDSNVVRFIRNSANAVYGEMHLSYTTGGPPGTGKVLCGSISTTAGSGTFVTTDDNSPFSYWLFGSLDRFMIFTEAGSRIGVGDVMYVGSYTRSRSTNVATCTNSPAAGTSVTFSTTNTGFFTVGKRYTIVDANNFESPKVTAINGGVSVTLDILTNSYTSGARLGEDPRPGIVTTQGPTPGIGIANWVLAPPMRGTVAIAANTAALVAAEFVCRTVDLTMVERIGNPDGGPDGGGGGTASGTFDMWPVFVADESNFSGGYLGTLTECYVISRAGIATDDTITVGGSTYHYINLAAPITATANNAAIGIVCRQS